MSVDRSHITTFLTYNAQIHEGSIQSVHKHNPCSSYKQNYNITTCPNLCFVFNNLHIRSECAQKQHCIHNMDSDLEAFNRNPTHGSIATLAYRLAAFALCMN